MNFAFEARTFFAPFVILGSTLFTAACGDDANPAPTKPPVIAEEDAGGGDDAGGADTTEQAQSTDDTKDVTDVASGATSTAPSEVDAGVNTGGGPLTTEGDTFTGAGSDGGSSAEVPDCIENAEACFSCPSSAEQFPLRCTEGECKAFDNEGRLGRYVAGQPLPVP